MNQWSKYHYPAAPTETPALGPLPTLNFLGYYWNIPSVLPLADPLVRPSEAPLLPAIPLLPSKFCRVFVRATCSFWPQQSFK
jgi:hypothetical protein